MPTYEYACRDCGQHVEVVQSFRDDALTVCPTCEGRLRKVFAAAGIIFKGSGYYVNDSRKQPAKAGANGGSESAKEPAGGAAKDAGGDGGKGTKGGDSGDAGTAKKAEPSAKSA